MKSISKKTKHVSKKNSKSEDRSFLNERVAIFIALFFFAFGMGLISDGKKIYSRQLKLSQRVDYKATLNPYSTN